MNIQKTPGNINSKNALETSAQKATSKANAAHSTAQTAKSAASAVSKIPPSSATQTTLRSLSSLISAAGLPADKLSASIISFARFFSLPLKPELLKHIRQQAFEAAPNAASPEPAPAAEDGEPETGAVFKSREALSLAASAAESKGVELEPKSLEAYAQAVDPEWRKRQDGEQHDQRGKRNKNDNEKEEASLQKTAAMSAAGLEKMALEGAEKDPLLAILNRLPEKDGKRWIVLPFDFSDNGREFKVSLRILLEKDKIENRADCMAIDIAIRNIIKSGKTEKKWLFVLEPANKLSVYIQEGNLRLTTDQWTDSVEVQEGNLRLTTDQWTDSVEAQLEITPAQQVSLVRELSALLKIAPERIFIKTQTKHFPFEAGCGDDFLRSIDEAV